MTMNRDDVCKYKYIPCRYDVYEPFFFFFDILCVYHRLFPFSFSFLLLGCLPLLQQSRRDLEMIHDSGVKGGTVHCKLQIVKKEEKKWKYGAPE